MLLDKAFGIFCLTHPDEFHDTLCFRGDKANNTVKICLDIRFDVSEWNFYYFCVPIGVFETFEKKLKETGTAIIEAGESLLAMKINETKLYFLIKVQTIEKSFEKNDWSLVKEK